MDGTAVNRDNLGAFVGERKQERNIEQGTRKEE